MSDTNTVSPLRLRMLEDMAGRKLNPHTQRGHIYSCKRFAAWLKRSPDTATPDEVRRFQLHLVESGMSICNRNRIMTGVRFLLESSWEVINEARDRSACLPRCGCCEIVISAHSGNSIQLGIFSRLPAGSITQTTPSPRSALRRIRRVTP
jgi:hypothetical protein